MLQNLADHGGIVNDHDHPFIAATGTAQGIGLIHSKDQFRPGGAGGLAEKRIGFITCQKKPRRSFGGEKVVTLPLPLHLRRFV